LAIYKVQWDKLHITNNISFREHVASQFNKAPKATHPKNPRVPLNTSAKISKVPPPIPPCLSPEALKKAKDKHRDKKLNNHPVRKSFMQVAKGNKSNLLKLHKTFPTLPAKKIIEMNNVP